jgi:membrane protein implicated in regulation of membrane protease activity
MESWWQGLTALNQWFFVSAAFFSVLSLWQTLSALLGVGGHSHEHVEHLGHEGHVGHGGAGVHTHVAVNHAGNGHHAAEAHHHASHADDRVAFTFVSIRSVIAFGTLFSWAGGLYLMEGTSPVWAILYSSVWGVVAMFAASYVIYKLLGFQETGNITLTSALGEEGTVYIALPPGGVGQVRVMVSGVISHVKARSNSDEPLIPGTRVKVIGIDDNNVIEVKALEREKGE